MHIPLRVCAYPRPGATRVRSWNDQQHLKIARGLFSGQTLLSAELKGQDSIESE